MGGPHRRLRHVERAAWLIGLALLGLYLVARVHGAAAGQSDLERFREARSALASSSTVPDRSSPHAEGSTRTPTEIDFRLWSEGRIEAYRKSLEASLDLPLGILRIPSIGLEVPIHAGTDELVLNRAVGWIEGTARPGRGGNVGIAGHRDGYFRGLKDVGPGDLIEVETLTATETYAIGDIAIVDPEDVWVLDPTPEPSLTLVTCYPFYFVGKAPRRYIVKANRQPSPSESTSAGTLE